MSLTRRELLTRVGDAAFASGVIFSAGNLSEPRASFAQATGTESSGSSPGTVYDSLPVRVNSPVTMKSWRLPATRVVMGGGYKPCLAALPGGGLVMVSLGREALPENKFRETTPLWRSKDGGLTWSGPTIVKDLIGREQWLTCTSDGTLLATSSILANDANNPHGFGHAYHHRSTDGGRTWQRTRIVVEGYPEKMGTITSRNVVELPDKTLLLGVSINQTKVGYLWRSTDGGQTWDRSLQVKIGDYGKRPYDNLDGFFAEDWTYRNASGKLLHFIRCGPPSPMYPMEDGRGVPKGDDGIDRTMRCESTDGGRTWGNLRDFSDYGMHYPRILRLQDGRLLMTITQRGVIYPIGLQAILSHDDGETWDWNRDRIIIEGKSPWGGDQGGGFGNTLQLKDGTLVSCYSHRGADNKTYIEVVRWSLQA